MTKMMIEIPDDSGDGDDGTDGTTMSREDAVGIPEKQDRKFETGY